ncbi:WD40 repeat protein [Kribbella sp. VKM Ac-2568]|nr:WD40 repeat protein [Kribbella sp. VKM Ac-2568]
MALSAVFLTAAVPATAVTGFTTSTQQAASVPSVPLGVRVKGTFTGIDLAWNLPADEGTVDGVTGFVVRRSVNGTETAYTVPRTAVTTFTWQDTERLPKATYSVAAVNADGEGPSSTPGPADTVPGATVADPTDAITVAHTVTTGGVSRTFLGQIAVQGATHVIPIAASGPTQQVDKAIAASADGRQVVFSQAKTSLWTVSAVVPHAQPVKILDGSSGITAKSWSPDGTRIAFEREQDGTSCVEVIGATGGAPIRVGCNLAAPSWLPDNQALIVKDQVTGKLQRVQAKAGGVVLTTYAGTELAQHPVASPNGLWIAYFKNTSVNVIPVGGGTPVPAYPFGTSGESISWARSNLLLVARRTESGSTLQQVPVNDGRPYVNAQLFDPPAGELVESAVWQGPRITIKPTAAAVGPNLSVPFDTTGLANPYVSCEFDGVKTAPCPASPFQKAGVAAGTHVLRVWAVEAGGRGTEAVRWLTVDTAVPSVRITGPTFDVTKLATARVTYSGTDNSGIGSYDVRWRIASTAANFGAYATIKSGTTASSVAIGVAAGYEYCVSVRARDIAGNLSAWTADKCFSRPSDDRRMGAAKGWVRAAHPAYYLGTATVTKAKSISVSQGVQAKRLFLIATKCVTCGSLNVYYNGKYVGVVNLYKATTEYQAVVPLPVPATFLTGSVLLTTRVTGKIYQIDGLAVRRT